MIELNKVYNESANMTAERFADKQVNLIVTSPPYADARKDTYGGVHPDQFIDWIRDIAIGWRRILADDGSLIINIGDVTRDGETHLFTYELPIMMKRELGFCFIDPLIWHKTTVPPGKYPNRFKGAWEFCYHFSMSKNIKFRPDNVKMPAKKQSIERALRHKSTNLNESTTGSGFTSANENTLRRIRSTGSNFSAVDANFEGLMDAYPSNVLHLAPESISRNHSAVFPVTLPSFFIKAFTDEGDIVYDPFGGSGTTGEASLRLHRNFVLSEIMGEYIPDIEKRLHPFRNKLF